MILDIGDIEFTKAEEKQLKKRLKEIVLEMLYEDVGYEIAEKVIKANKAKMEKEIKHILATEYKELASKIVIRKLGL